MSDASSSSASGRELTALGRGIWTAPMLVASVAA